MVRASVLGGVVGGGAALLIFGCSSTSQGFIPLGGYKLAPQPRDYDPPIIEVMPQDVDYVVVARLYVTKVPKTAFDRIHEDEMVELLKSQARRCGADAIGPITWQQAITRSLNGQNTFYGYRVEAEALYFPHKHAEPTKTIKDPES